METESWTTGEAAPNGELDLTILLAGSLIIVAIVTAVVVALPLTH